MVEELMLLENPRKRRRRRNIGGKMFNPYLLENPRRRRRRSNPARAVALRGTMREWTQGVDLMDAGAAVGGLAMATMIPGMLVRTADTMGQKIMKLAVSLGSAIGAGAIGRAMISPAAGKAAIIGGVAGAAAQALGMFTNIKIGQPARRHFGTAEPVPSTPTVPTSLIMP